MDNGGEGWEANPFDVVSRPAMPCDLCKTFKVDASQGDTASVTMALPRPPFWPVHRDDGVVDVHSIPTTRVTARKVEFEFYATPMERGDVDSLVSQATEALCTEALHMANREIMASLRTIAPVSIGKHGIDSLLKRATDMCAIYPYPQFPLGAAFLLPSFVLGTIMDMPDTQVHLDHASHVSHVFVGGVEAIAYAELPDRSQAEMPEYVLPRHGGVGLVISNVAIWASEEGANLHFRAHCYVGAGAISKNIVSVVP